VLENEMSHLAIIRKELQNLKAKVESVANLLIGFVRIIKRHDGV